MNRVYAKTSKTAQSRNRIPSGNRLYGYQSCSTALKQIPGIPIINSINLEGDGSRFYDIVPVMRKFGAPAVSMCIGPKGMAKTSEDKLR